MIVSARERCQLRVSPASSPSYPFYPHHLRAPIFRSTMPAVPQEALYPSRSGAGSFLGRQLYQRCPPPAIVLGVTPTGVEVAAAAAKAMSCSFDVIVGASI